MKRSTTIRFTTLPHRARRLDEGELSRVFGGCRGEGQECIAPCDCCQGLWCAENLAPESRKCERR
jgi:hypothetical protein